MKKFLVVLFAIMLIFGFATSAYAAYSDLNGTPGTTQPTGFEAPDSLGTGDDTGSGNGNANDTGNTENGIGTSANDGTQATRVIKSTGMTNINGTVETQRTHGAYQNNTNSCASCHQTHTAAADSLLFKGGVYNTCTACHDGTLGFYNVFADRNMADPDVVPSAGSFGTLTADNTGNPSVHLCTGTATISAAPGGNRSGGAFDPLNGEAAFGSDGGVAGDNGTWTASFDCAECHAPHGSYSDRLLHYSPNGMGAVSTKNGGLKVDDVPKIAYDPAMKSSTLPLWSGSSAPYLLVEGTVEDFGITTEAAGTKVMVLFKSKNIDAKTGLGGGAPYDRDNTYFNTPTPWLSGPNVGTPNTSFQTLANGVVSDGIDIIYGKGYVKEKTTGTFLTINHAHISRAYVVKLGGEPNSPFPMKPVDGGVSPALTSSTFGGSGGVLITKVDTHIYDEAGYGKAITAYCAACHTDYQAGGVGIEGTGMYSIAFRHNTTNELVSCLKCHYAHGTNVNVMRDAQDKLASETSVAYMLDKNPSSALKRYTNMAVCWKCHTVKLSELLTNNQGYWDNHAPAGGANPLGPDAPASGNW